MESTVGKSVDESRENLKNGPKFQLKQKIGLWSGVSVIAGTVIGSGIFISPVGVLSGANGSVGVSLLLWTACGLFSALAALCYAELGASIVESGSDFAYLNAAYGGPIAFMYAISYIAATSPAADAAKAVTFGTYLATPFYPGCVPPNSAIKCAAVGSVLVLGLVNYVSVSTAARVQVIFAVAKFVGMLIIIIAGFVELGMGAPVGITNFRNGFVSESLSGIAVSHIALGFYQGLFSYSGWSKLNFITEELTNPGKTLPRAIIISISSCTLLYLSVNIAYLSVLTPADMLSSKAVAVTFGSRVLPALSWIMPVFVSLSVFGSLNGSLLTGCRVVFAAARRRQLPQVLSMVHVGHNTPAPALIVQVAIILILIALGDFDVLIAINGFTSWIFHGLCAIGVLVLRRKYKDLHRPYKVPFIIPVIVLIFALFLIIVPLVLEPELAYVYGLVLLVVSAIVYYPFVHKEWRLPGMDAFTIYFQELFDVSPTEWDGTAGLDMEHED